MSKCPKVCIIGAEDWASAISTAVCKNVLNDQFHSRVHIYVYDELVRSNYLSEVMNERHENIKYLPGIRLPNNLIAVNDLLEASQQADILIFATHCSFVKAYCNILAGNVKKTAYAVSLVKGLEHIRDGEIDLYSHAISQQLQIPCYSMMNASSAMEMAQGKLCEITIGCNNDAHAAQLTSLFQTDNCMVFTIDDVDGVELCNTLKDLVALSAGFIDGLRLGENARVACLHLGLKEMMRFIDDFNPSTNIATFLESCGLAHSVASSYADKNVTFAKNFVNSRKTIQEIEANLQNGRKLLGPIIAEEIYAYIRREDLETKYPLFSILHRICQREVMPHAIVDTLRNHPDLCKYSVTQLQNPTPTSDILENLEDTLPEFSSTKNKQILLDEMDGMWRAYFNNFIDANNSKKLEDLSRKPQVAMGSVDGHKIEGGNVEILFEMGDKKAPNVSLRLKETVTNPPITAIGSLNSPTTQNGAQELSSVNTSAIMGSQFQNGNDHLLNNRQQIEMSLKETDITDGKESADKIGLNDLDQEHENLIDSNYKGLKVTVKNKNQDSDKQKISETPNKKTELQRKTEALDSKETDASNKIEDFQGEQILYDKDSTFGMRLFDDEPNAFKLLELVEPNEQEAKKKKVVDNRITENHQDKNVSEHRKKDISENNTKVNTDSKDDKIKSEFVENKTNPERYKYDYTIHIESKKVPLQYSRTDNSFPPIKEGLEAQNYWKKYKFLNLDKEKQIDMNQEVLLMSPVKPILAKNSNNENLHQQQLINNNMQHFPYHNNVYNKPENKIINDPIAKDINKSDSMKINKPGNQESHNQEAFETSPVLGASSNFLRNDTVKIELRSIKRKIDELSNEKPILPKTIEPVSKSSEGSSKDSSKVQLNQRQTVENKGNEKISRLNIGNDKSYWESDSEKILQAMELSPKLQVDVEDTIIDMKIPEAYENNIKISSKIQNDDDLKQNRESIMFSNDKKQPFLASLKKKVKDIGNIPKLDAKVDNVISKDNEPREIATTIRNEVSKNYNEHQVEWPKASYTCFSDKSREQMLSNENSERDERTKEKFDVERKSYKKDRHLSAQTVSKYHNEGREEMFPFDRDVDHVEKRINDKDQMLISANRESDERTNEKADVERKSHKEDRHLSAQTVSKYHNEGREEMFPFDRDVDHVEKRSNDKDQMLISANRESDERTNEKAEFERKSQSEDRHLSAQTVSKYHNEGRKEIFPFDRDVDRDQKRSNDKDQMLISSNRESDERTNEKAEVERKSHKEDRHLSAQTVSKYHNKYHNNANRESDRRTDEKAEVERKSHKEDRHLSAQTDSKYHYKGRKYMLPFDGEDAFVETRGYKINRESDERTKEDTKFVGKSRQEDQSAQTENDKISNKLNSEWDWLLDNDKFDDALDDIRQEKLKHKAESHEQRTISAKNEPSEDQQIANAWPYESDLKGEALSIERARDLASPTQSESKTKSRQEETWLISKEDEPRSKRKRKQKLSAEQRAEMDRPELKERVKQIIKHAKESFFEGQSSHKAKSNVDEKKINKITTKLTKIMRKKRKDHLKAKKQATDYHGARPFIEDEDILPKLSYTNTEERRNTKLRKITVKPFHPPLNPRVRIPRPPFDVRDHKYHHTFNFRPLTSRTAPQPRTSLTLTRHVEQASSRKVATLPRPALKLPPFMMRSSVLAIELGLFAAVLSRYRGGRK